MAGQMKKATDVLDIPALNNMASERVGWPTQKPLALLDLLVRDEIAPALVPLDVTSYWKTVVTRFENPMIDHRLAQIAEDGSLKLRQRLFPLLVDNARAGRPLTAMVQIVRAWLELMATTPSRDPANAWFADWAKAGADKAKALDNPALFPAPFREDTRLRLAVLD